MEGYFVIVMLVSTACFFIGTGSEMIKRDRDYARRENEMKELEKEQKERHARYAAERKRKGMDWIN